ncbi:hypothetical protein FRB95_004774 [Tulasnella sp. JGI-2019a]|nr:hypothetical protein FRB95_004774 [Tulasnella sp. JGI-2019a]
MADIPFDAAHFFGPLLSVWLYALFLSMFLSAIWPLWRRRHRPGGKFVVAVTLCLFVTATGLIVTTVAKGYDIFVKGSASLDTAGYSDKGYLLKVALNGWFFVVAIWNAEVILIWRLWIVWSRDWRVAILPAALFLIELASGIALCATFGPGNSLNTTVHNGHGIPGFLSAICLLLVNMICTPMVIARLWWAGRQVQIRQTRSLYQTVTIRLIESGSLYTVASFVWVMSILPPGSPYPGVAVFLNYVFQMVLSTAPMMIFSLLSQEVVSEAHDINTTNSEGAGEPSHRPGAVSTTIQFQTPPMPSGTSETPFKGSLSC